MRFPLACLVAAVLLAPAAMEAGVACPPPTPANVLIVYTGPVSNCTFISGSCAVAETIQFNVATFGVNLACAPHTFNWNFGDGGTGVGQVPTHAYASPGTYTVSMTLADPQGNSFTVTALVTVAAPVPATSTPALVLLALALVVIAVARLAVR